MHLYLGLDTTDFKEILSSGTGWMARGRRWWSFFPVYSWLSPRGDWHYLYISFEILCVRRHSFSVPDLLVTMCLLLSILPCVWITVQSNPLLIRAGWIWDYYTSIFLVLIIPATCWLHTFLLKKHYFFWDICSAYSASNNSTYHLTEIRKGLLT